MKFSNQRQKRIRNIAQNQGLIPEFIVKLYNILERQEFKSIIKWNQEGDAFQIMNQSNFSNIVLPQYFKHKNYFSFVRQLNIYGFNKTRNLFNNNQNQFKNILFKRNHKELLKNIRRKTIEKNVSLINITGMIDLENNYPSNLEKSEVDLDLISEIRKLKVQMENYEKALQYLYDDIKQQKLEKDRIWKELLKEIYIREKQEKKMESIIKFMFENFKFSSIALKKNKIKNKKQVKEIYEFIYNRERQSKLLEPIEYSQDYEMKYNEIMIKNIYNDIYFDECNNCFQEESQKPFKFDQNFKFCLMNYLKSNSSSDLFQQIRTQLDNQSFQLLMNNNILPCQKRKNHFIEFNCQEELTNHIKDPTPILDFSLQPQKNNKSLFNYDSESQEQQIIQNQISLQENKQNIEPSNSNQLFNNDFFHEEQEENSFEFNFNPQSFLLTQENKTNTDEQVLFEQIH